jgi:hypothetical protein
MKGRPRAPLAYVLANDALLPIVSIPTGSLPREGGRCAGIFCAEYKAFRSDHADSVFRRNFRLAITAFTQQSFYLLAIADHSPVCS